MALTPYRLNQSSTEYGDDEDFDFENDHIGIGSASNSGKLAKTLLRRLTSAMNFRKRIVDARDWVDLDPTGGNDNASVFTQAHTQAAAFSPRAIVQFPTGSFLIGSTATGQVSMHGSGGAGYGSYGGRTLFIPGMTNGTPCLRWKGIDGIDLRRFAVSAGGASPNPHPSTGNVPLCIGLQAGKCAALITAITKTTATSVTIETKYLHTFEVGDVLTCDGISGMTELNSGTTASSTVSAVDLAAKTVTLTTVNNAAWGAYVSGGFIYPTDLGVAGKVARGVIRDVTVDAMSVGAHIQGWNGEVRLRSTNNTLGFDGSYLNATTVDLVLENNYQDSQWIGCEVPNITRYCPEIGTTGSGGAASTVDATSSEFEIKTIRTEGTRSTAWLDVGLVSAVSSFQARRGNISATSGSYEVNLGNVTRWAVPPGARVSKTGSTLPGISHTPTWAGSVSNPSIGNGTLLSYYTVEGNTVILYLSLTIGSTTSAGSGTWTFSLPYTAGMAAVGAAKILDSGTAHLPAEVTVDSGASVCKVYGHTVSAGALIGDQVAHNYPISWATGDTLVFTLKYQR